jgi:hypothetical protein
LFCISIIFLSGCATVPFKPAAEIPMASVSADEVRTQFARSQSPKYEAVQSVVLEIFGHEMTGLGYLSVDQPASAFALACMTPMGMKLFDIQGRGDAVETIFSLPQFGKREELAGAVGLDFKRTYFENIPDEDAEIRREKNRLIFIQRREGGRTEYDFGGPDRMLLEKRIYKGWKMTCRIRYYDYVGHDGFFYPHGIVMQNRTHHYRLLLRLKSVYPARAE